MSSETEVDTTPTPTGTDVDADSVLADLILEDEVDDVNADGDTDIDGADGQDDDPAKDADDPEADEANEGDDPTWSSVLGLDDVKIAVDDKGDFAGINVKVDGVEETVGMEALVKGYQTDKHNANTGKALSGERKQFEADRESVVQEYTKRLEDVQGLTQYLNKTLVKEFDGVNWEQLKLEDPAQYAADMMDFQARQAEIQKVHGAIGQEREWQNQQNQQKDNAQSDEYLEKQIGRMIDNNPSWKDEAVLKTAFNEMSDFTVETYGFTSDEFNGVVDSRLIELIKDAQKYRKGQKVASRKISKKVPKFQKPGSGKMKRVSKLDKLTKRAKASTGQAKRVAQTDAIAELLTGG